MPVDRPLFTDSQGRLLLTADGQLGCCCGGGEEITYADSGTPQVVVIGTTGTWEAV